MASNEWIKAQYEAGWSAARIADACDLSRGGVEYRLHRMQVAMRGRWPGKWKPKCCAKCGRTFVPPGPASKFCSKGCQRGRAQCQSCGKTFVKRPTQGEKSANDNRYCSYECRWADAKTRDEYGRYLNSEGYVVLHKRWSTKAPSRGLKDGYVRLNVRQCGRIYEHRHAMEQKLVRPLADDETVHHVNGIKTDNRPENLELWVSRHPRGQRVEDVTKWAAEMLQRYAPERLT